MKAKFVHESLLEFEKGQDPKAAIGIGRNAKIKKWFDEYNERKASWEDPAVYKINPDGSVDIKGDFRFHGDREIPEFIKFNTIHGNFTMQYNDYLENLDFLPDHIKGNLDFYANSIRLTPKRFNDLGIQVDGDITLLDPRKEGEREASKRYRERGPLSSRSSIKFEKPAKYGPKYTPGYQLYNMLKYMESKGKEGARYIDLIQIAFDMSYPNLKGQRPFSTGWGVGYFSPKWRSPIGTKADKNEKGRWVINDKGKQWLKDKAHLFEDPKF